MVITCNPATKTVFVTSAGSSNVREERFIKHNYTPSNKVLRKNCDALRSLIDEQDDLNAECFHPATLAQVLSPTLSMMEKMLKSRKPPKANRSKKNV